MTLDFAFAGTIWSLLPPIIAIVLALITKEVYISLFIGVLSGAILTANFSPMGTVNSLFDVMTAKVGDPWNIGILIFLVFLGIMVALMTKAGGSAAYAKWASGKIKSRRGASLATFGLGALIFVDDYFNCLTVGSVMRPVTDKFKISRAKLAYIIDATAAPICIIAPISSWAAAVTGYTEGDGFSLFLRTIPFNLYAWLTIIMVIVLAVTGKDFGSMAKHEEAAQNGDLFLGKNEYENVYQENISSKGKVADLVLPVVFLIFSCITCMVYTGGFFDGKGIGFVEAFSSCDASRGLVLGSFFALLFTFLLYIPRRIIGFKDFADCIPQGFKMMVPAILILVLAWTLSGFCRDQLLAGEFVSNAIKGSSIATTILPFALFLIAVGLAFSTGTSWGAFGVLIPIVTAVFPADAQLLVICVSAVLAGAVCGDHISPISDTTIMASAGAQCNHINHVSTQIPYAVIVAIACGVGYLAAGFTENLFITWAAGLGMLIILLFVKLPRKKEQ